MGTTGLAGTTRYLDHCRACGAFIDRKPWDHECPMYRTEEPLADLDEGFTVILSRTPAELAESMRRYRRSLR